MFNCYAWCATLIQFNEPTIKLSMSPYNLKNKLKSFNKLPKGQEYMAPISLPATPLSNINCLAMWRYALSLTYASPSYIPHAVLTGVNSLLSVIRTPHVFQHLCSMNILWSLSDSIRKTSNFCIVLFESFCDTHHFPFFSFPNNRFFEWKKSSLSSTFLFKSIIHFKYILYRNYQLTV